MKKERKARNENYKRHILEIIDRRTIIIEGMVEVKKEINEKQREYDRLKLALDQGKKDIIELLDDIS